MQISDILTEALIVSQLDAQDKESALAHLSQHIANYGDTLASSNEILRALVNRENLGSTGVGGGVAIPHAKIPGLNRLVGCFGLAPKGVPFDSIDGKPVSLVFVLLVPESSAGAHLKALARVSRLLKEPELRSRLLHTTTQSAIYQVFLDADRTIG